VTRYTVIGGGIAGLVAAVSLAKRGKRVRLLERRSKLGGRAASTVDQGFTFNFGPHAMYKHGATYRTLDEWGIAPPGARPDLSRNADLVLDGQRVPLPLNAMEAMRSMDPDTAPRISVAEWLDSNVESPDQRKVMETFLRLSCYAADPLQLSLALTIKQLRLSAGGVLYVHGGWQTMIDLLTQAAISVGVEVETSATVTQVESPAVLAIPPQEVEALLGRPIDRPPAIRMACLDLGLSRLPEGGAHFALSADQPMYLSVQSQWAKIADNGSAVHVAQYRRSGDSVERANLEAFADIVMPGWREQVLTSRYLPEMIVVHAAPSVAGRPAVDALGIEGVRIAGDWVGPHGMLADAATESGLAAAASLA